MQLFMHEAIVKHIIQGPECIKQGINSIWAKFHIFPKMIKGVNFMKEATVISLNFTPYYRSSI